MCLAFPDPTDLSMFNLLPVFNSSAGMSWDYGSRWQWDGGKGEEEEARDGKHQ